VGNNEYGHRLWLRSDQPIQRGRSSVPAVNLDTLENVEVRIKDVSHHTPPVPALNLRQPRVSVPPVPLLRHADTRSFISSLVGDRRLIHVNRSSGGPSSRRRWTAR
jgi:hypothetical protein